MRWGNVARSPGNASFPLLRVSFPLGNTARSPGKAPRGAHRTGRRPHHAEPRIPQIPSRRGLTNRSTGLRLCTSPPSVKRILPRTLRRRRLGRGFLRIAGLRRRIWRRASLQGFPRETARALSEETRGSQSGGQAAFCSRVTVKPRSWRRLTKRRAARFLSRRSK